MINSKIDKNARKTYLVQILLRIHFDVYTTLYSTYYIV